MWHVVIDINKNDVNNKLMWKLCYFNLNIPLRELWKIDMYIIIITIIIHF